MAHPAHPSSFSVPSNYVVPISQGTPATPPPPPPKPQAHESNRSSLQHTARLSSPRPPSTPPKEVLTPSQLGAGTPVITAGPGAALGEAFSIGTRAEPPGVDEGWIPDILKDKSTVDLQSILSDTALLNALANLHPSHAAAQTQLNTLLATNRSLAVHLLELQSHVDNLYGSAETLLLQHQSLELSWRKKQTEMDTELAPWSPKSLYQRLVAAVAEQEAICRAVEESFLEEGEHQHGKAGEREVVDWMKRVRAEGAKLEARKEARARWDEGRVGGWR